jgi:hypothetical protein
LSLKVVSAEVVLDETRAPYGEVQLRIHTPAETDAELIDPRNILRVALAVSQQWKAPARATQNRSLNLLLHARTFDHDTGDTILTLRTDEARLIDDGLIATTVSTAAYAYESSLRAICNFVLATIGASLAAGTDDADYTRTANATNVVRNPRVGVNTTDWSNAGTAATLARVATGGPNAAAPTFFRATLAANAAPLAMIMLVDRAGIPLVAGTVYAISVWVRTSNTGISAGLDGLTYNAANVQQQDLIEVAVPLTANVWKQLTFQFTAAATVDKMTVRVFNIVGTFTTGATLDMTGLRVSPVTGVHDFDFFDGATTDTLYTYAWAGTAHASASTRTRLDTRPLTLLDREPGQASWDFLQPLVQQAGLRLFCDELRVWRLVDSNSYTVDGTISVAEAINLVHGVDDIDLGGDWATGVVVKYTWTDATGATQTAYDAAGTSTKVTTVEWERAYAGPGAAAAILGRMNGRGRVLALGAVADLAATPGQYTTATVPAAPTQTGIAARIAFTIPDGLMDVATRGLIDYSTDDWIGADPALDWISVTATKDWATYTP